MREQDLELLKIGLYNIKERGWIEGQRAGNCGNVGNTVEDLLGIAENSYSLPDFGAWEIKSRGSDSSLLTLFHLEPSRGFIARHYLPAFGWRHQEAGTRYPENERSFRQTVSTQSTSSRGFRVHVDRENQVVFVSFSPELVNPRDHDWLAAVMDKPLPPAPVWKFSALECSLRKKLNNLLYCSARTKEAFGTKYFQYTSFEAYIGTNLEQFLSLLEDGSIYVDFDARTGHNHGTKFRIKAERRDALYQYRLTV